MRDASLSWKGPECVLQFDRHVPYSYQRATYPALPARSAEYVLGPSVPGPAMAR